MACEAIEQLLISEANRLGPDLYRRSLDTSIWLKLVRQSTWDDEMGDVASVLTYERTLPGTVTFADYKMSDRNRVLGGTFTDVNTDYIPDDATTDGSPCVVPATKLHFAQTIRQYNLQKAAIESPDICLENLRFPVKRREQLSAIVSIMNDVTAWVWKERYRDEYVRLAGNKVVIRGSLPTSPTAMPALAATSQLTQGVLDHFYMELIRKGGGANPMDRNQGAPVFLLSMSAETSQALIKQNDDIRQDFRFSGRVNELLAPMGINRPYGGFYHAIEDFPPRYDFVGGAWVRRPAYVETPTTMNSAPEVNPLYEAAEFEDTILFHIDGYESKVPAPIGGLPGGMQFDPQSYRGDFRWRNIPDRVCNPDGNIGWFRAIFGNGSKPIFPQYMYVFRHLRCPSELGLINCSGQAVTGS